MALQAAAKKSALLEKAIEKQQMDALVQRRTEEDRQYGEQRKYQQNYYRNALDLQSAPYSSGAGYDSRKDKAALAMEAGVDPSRPNPIAGYRVYTGGHHGGGSVLKEAGLSALQSK